MRVTNWKYQDQAVDNVQIHRKNFNRGWRMRHLNPNIHLTSEKIFKKLSNILRNENKFCYKQRKECWDSIWCLSSDMTVNADQCR